MVAPWYSYAPMSQVEPRGVPRMSVVKYEERLAPALMAGLLTCNVRSFEST